MNTLSLLEVLASTTWEMLRNASVSQIQLREDAITAFNLLALATARNSWLIEVEDKSRTESETGCDFEMWIQRKDYRWLRLAVQAKKLDNRSGAYKQIRHKVGKELQIDILERYASVNNALASYCFYNYWPTSIASPCVGLADQSQLGCTIASSSTVRKVLSIRGGAHFLKIHGGSGAVPWRCLLKCFPLGFLATGANGRAFETCIYEKLPRAFDAVRKRRVSIIPARSLEVFGADPVLTPKRVIILGANEEG